MKPARSTARRVSALSGFYSYAVDEGLVARSPLARVCRPRVGDEGSTLGLDQAELGALLRAALDSGPRDPALACLLA
jgi:integrase/recombinase XerD